MAFTDSQSPAAARDACPSQSSNKQRDGETTGPLNLLVLLFHGHRAARRRLCIQDVRPSTTTASFLKEKVASSLRETPNEVFMLVGDSVMFDSEVLSDYTIEGQTSLRAVVFYANSTQWWQKANRPPGGFMAEEVFLIEGSGCVEPEVMTAVQDEPVSALAPNGFNASDVDNKDVQFSWGDLSSKEAEILVKPGMQKKTIPREFPWTGEETKLIDSGKLFTLAMHCRIIMVRRWHERIISMPASSQTTVGEIEGRLAEWLGAAPDELVLTLEDQVLETGCRLEEYQIGPASIVVAMAWYKSAV